MLVVEEQDEERGAARSARSGRAPLPLQRIHSRLSRSVHGTASPESSSSRDRGLADDEQRRPAPRRSRRRPGSRTPPRARRRASAIGRTIAAIPPPIGIAVWRIPSASPRSSGGNHCMTARPLAAFTLAPAAPASVSRPTSRREAAGEAGRQHQNAAEDEPDREHEAFADPVGEQPPGQQREDRADPDAPRARSRPASTRGRTPPAAPERAPAGRSGPPRTPTAPPSPRQGRPSDTSRLYSPKGFAGFGEVETITLFVSR